MTIRKTNDIWIKCLTRVENKSKCWSNQFLNTTVINYYIKPKMNSVTFFVKLKSKYFHILSRPYSSTAFCITVRILRVAYIINWRELPVEMRYISPTCYNETLSLSTGRYADSRARYELPLLRLFVVRIISLHLSSVVLSKFITSLNTTELCYVCEILNLL